ncbi:hypothetical protein D3C77_266020 [compost metagenome]
MASKPKRVEVYRATTRPRRASGASLCSKMLVPTLHRVIANPSTAMANSDSHSWVLAANTSMASALPAALARMNRPSGAVLRLPARTTLAISEPSPAAPHSQPRVRASPAKMSRANTGSSTT